MALCEQIVKLTHENLALPTEAGLITSSAEIK